MIADIYAKNRTRVPASTYHDQTGVKARPRREPVKSGKGASQGTVVGPALAKTGRDRAAGVEE
eukprot:COSAG02_NODE_46210_length_351_cov_0.250000_1_plen_62_part_10